MAIEFAVASTSTSTTTHQNRAISYLINTLRRKLSSPFKMLPSSSKEVKKPAPPPIRAQHVPDRMTPPRPSSSSKSSKMFDLVFDYFDGNGDGKISPAELLGCMNVGGGEEVLSLKEAEELVHSADSDGDGLLGFDDFVALVDSKEEEERGRSLEEAFQVYEAQGEGGGVITAKSLRKALRRLGESRSMEECRAMISEFDLNGDGVINFEEFKRMMV